MSSPKVTVLMPVYNGEKYLKAAIESILNQDFADFEFLIINDGSTDSSSSIISSFADPRIRVVVNSENSGLVNTLNRGLELALGEYIARMDCDDISDASRLSIQVKLMDENKNVGASGSFYKLLRNNKSAVADFPLSHKEIQCFMIFNSPIAHPSAIIRSSILKEYKLNFSNEYTHCEDYNLWSQIATCAELKNTSAVLLEYRVHENQITGNQKFASVKINSLNKIRSSNLQMMGVHFDDAELAIHNFVSNGEKPADLIRVKAAETWLKKIAKINDRNKVLDKSYLEKIILERWLRVCFNYFGAKAGFIYFYRSELFKNIKLPLVRKVEFIKQLYYSYKRLN